MTPCLTSSADSGATSFDSFTQRVVLPTSCCDLTREALTTRVPLNTSSLEKHSMTGAGWTLSPDGGHRWDGERWVPLRAPLAAQPWYATSIGDLRRRSVRAQVVFAAAVGMLVIIALGVIASLLDSERASDFGDAQQRAYCQDMDYSPAECAQ